MQPFTFLRLTLWTFPLWAGANLPVLAQSQPMQLQTEMQMAVIPQTAAVILSFPRAVMVDVGQGKDVPMTVGLAQPLVDQVGSVVAPAQTPVNIWFKPVEGGVQIVAESIVIRGQIVPLQAASRIIPGTTLTQTNANQKAQQTGSLYGDLFGSIYGISSGGNEDAITEGQLIGTGLGILTGLTAPDNVRVAQISQGSVHVLSLQSPLTLSLPIPSQQGSTPPVPSASAPNPLLPAAQVSDPNDPSQSGIPPTSDMPRSPILNPNSQFPNNNDATGFPQSSALPRSPLQNDPL